MKKIICALVGCFICGFARAASILDHNSQTLAIPLNVFAAVLDADTTLSAENKDKMWEKYDRVAGVYGATPLSAQDIFDICIAGGISTEQDCRTKIMNPAITIMKGIIFKNVCSGRASGGTQHCVDDVFVKDYLVRDSVNKSEIARVSNNEFAQEVSVNEFAAYGFAIEYAKREGHDVLCDSMIRDNFINCATVDNQHFYTFKFESTNNTNDSTITENLVRGICAMYDLEFVKKGFDGISVSDGIGLDINTHSDYGCIADKLLCYKLPGNKFGLWEGYRKESFKGGYYKDFCAMQRGEIHGSDYINRYPGYEYMTDAFREIQTVMGQPVIDILKTYVMAQGITVDSFDCDYSPIIYHDESDVDGTKISSSKDDLLRCHLNGKQVDFIFDDLFESKKMARAAGAAGMRCLLMKREQGTASFDGKYCKGPTEVQCLELSSQVQGGTHWDSGAGACVLNTAANLKTLNTTLTIAGGAAFAIGVTVLGGGAPLVVLLEAGASVALDLAFEGVNRFYETRPHHLATEFVQAAQACGLVGAEKMCSNKKCIQDVVSKYLASLDSVIGDGSDALNDDELKLVDGVYGRIDECLSDVEIKDAAKISGILSKDKVMSKASMALMIGGFFISPSNAMIKLSRLPKTAKILRRAGLKPIERVSSSLGGAKYNRIYVRDLSMPEITDVVDELRTKGFYVSSNMDESGKQFIGFSDQDVFGSWRNSKSNWLNNFGDATDIATLKARASKKFDEYLNEFLRTGQSRGIPIERLSMDEWNELSKGLSGQGVELYDDWMLNPKTGLQEQVMRFRRVGGVPSGAAGRGGDIFSKVYNSMPDEMLNAKLKYVYEHSASVDDAVKALKDVGAFDENIAREIAQDVANETIRRIQTVGGQDLVNRMKNWSRLSKQEKETLIYNLHELVTTQRRDHVGNTIVEVFDDPVHGLNGSHLAPSDSWVREFRYNISRDSIQGLLATIIHENTHALQSVEKSSIHPAFVSWAKRNYVQPDVNYELYYNNIVEIEARYVGNNAAAQVVRQLGL